MPKRDSMKSTIMRVVSALDAHDSSLAGIRVCAAVDDMPIIDIVSICRGVLLMSLHVRDADEGDLVTAVTSRSLIIMPSMEVHFIRSPDESHYLVEYLGNILIFGNEDQ